jgi:hypothetical protein
MNAAKGRDQRGGGSGRKLTATRAPGAPTPLAANIGQAPSQHQRKNRHWPSTKADLRPFFAKMPGYAPGMAIDRASPHACRSAKARRWASIGLVCLPLCLAAPASADWLGSLIGTVQQAVRQLPRSDARALAAVAAHIKTLAAKPEATVLAAQATPEGHWRFVNTNGETITAGTPQEMKRVVSLLVPDAKPEARLVLYLTEDTLFARRAALKDLPRGAELNIFAGDESYRVLRRSDGAGERLFAEIRANLVVELSDQQQFAEAAWQLARPLDKASIRVLALEPGSTPRLPSAPRLDAASKKPLIDSIDPTSLAAALGAVRGQTVLVTGRIEGRLLHFKAASGPDRSLLVNDLFSAAEEADVNLIVLHAGATPRQPGGRNWLWQKVEVKGLEEALQRPRVADFYNALATPNSRFAVSAKPAGTLRTLLQITPAPDLPRAPASRPIGDILSDAAASLTGRVITAGVEANVRSAELQRDIDWRLLPGVPAKIQIAYFVLVLIGLLGVPRSRLWWQRLWPQENAAEYAGRGGYWAAWLVRQGAFVVVFLPLTAPISAPLNLGRQIWDTLTAPIRGWRRLLGRRRPSEAAPAALGTSLPVRRAAPGLGNYRPSR